MDKFKLEKLKKLMELANRDTVSPGELTQVISILVKIIKKENAETDASIAGFSSQLQSFITRERQLSQNDRNSLSKDFQSLKKDVTAYLEKYKAEVLAKIPKIQERDRNLETDVETLKSTSLTKKDLVTETPESVKEKLETLKGEKRLDSSAIKGFENFEKNTVDRAVSILDQRTKFLINKNVKHDATLTGSGTDADPLSVVDSGGGNGDVAGPASATDNAIARFDGTGGKTLQNSGITISDTNIISGSGGVLETDSDLYAPMFSSAAGASDTGVVVTATEVQSWVGGNNELTLNATALFPTTDIGLDLGTTLKKWANLFVASIGATATRITKLWATDIESTNMPTVGGTAILTSLTAPQFTTIELGHASDTTLSRSAAGVIAVENVVIPSISSTNTLTNKAITRRVTTTTDDATAVIDVTLTDTYELSAIANNTTFSTTGTPTDGQKLIIRWKDAGVSKTLTWDAIFVAIGITLPTSTTAGKWQYVGCEYNSGAAKFHALAVSTQA